MSIPLRLVKRLRQPDPVPDADRRDAVLLRRFRGPEDIDAWLHIHQASFSQPGSQGRPWTRSDFRREFLDKPEWPAGAMWFAEEEGLGPIGTICWTPRTREPSMAEIRWLAVVPDWRRRGVASRLLNRAEQDCMDHGFTWARLETLAVWEPAVAFYRARGYVKG